MRYYLPLRDTNVKAKSRRPSLIIPLWVWIVVIALLMLVVLALR